MPVTVDLEKCVGSRDCLGACAFNAIEVQNGKAVIFENCVDCDACVRACPTHAIISSTAPATAQGGVLIVGFSDRSGIVSASERAAKRAGTATASVRVEPTDAGSAASSLAAYVKENPVSLVVLPHHAAGAAIAARLANELGASLLAGSSALALDESGGVKATRLRYGGIVRSTSRVGAGLTVATLVPRGGAPFAAQAIEGGQAPERVGDAPREPLSQARSVVVVDSQRVPEAVESAGACARALGAAFVEAANLPGAALAPELLIAVGLEGSTETSAAMRNAGTIVALVKSTDATVAQIADYIVAGDVAENSRALLAAL